MPGQRPPVGLCPPADLFLKASMARGQCHVLAAGVSQHRFVPRLAGHLPQGLGFRGRRPGLSGCAPTPRPVPPHGSPLHPDGFCPPQLLLPGLIEFSDDLLCFLGSETKHSEILGSV